MQKLLQFHSCLDFTIDISTIDIDFTIDFSSIDIDSTNFLKIIIQ